MILGHSSEMVARKRSKVEDHCKEKTSPTMEQSLKLCSDCQTSDTPLWRSGPHGPKSLCNACGIRYSKRRKTEFVGEEQSKPAALICKSNHKSAVEAEELKRRQREKQEKVLKIIIRRSSDLKVQRQIRTPARFGGSADGDEVAEAARLLLSLSSGLSVQY
ncbi:GATA transcription factor 15-like [Phalaenopsis equestris]|uniref:GATA transcription factor 15-like n=1 Tax=Phalaenopsis equestris TaxID=78828 RepID=UPI0009E33BF1|nr:GATA transcription factor 15-like [Phalaenopsis equestris]